MDFPKLPVPPVVRVRQRFPREAIADVEGEVRAQFDAAGLANRLRPGARVAVTAGSRGIADIVRVIRAVCAAIRDAGAEPFVVAAMGSHGGATAEGQRAVLAGYGIREDTVGAPIVSDMAVVELGRIATGAVVHQDRHAHEADAIVVVGRVKAHTAFRGEIESGLCKMLAVGLGKQPGAESIHAHGLRESIPQAAALAIQRSNVVLGLALVENAYHQLHTVRAVPPERFHETDRELLRLSNALLPRVPFDRLDVLVVGWLGKNVSGSGMDYNVVGMWRRIGGERRPDFRRIVALNITPESEGNGLGIGIADFTTRRLVDQLDLRKTYMNALTANAPQTVKIPIVLASDREAIEVALKSAEPDGPARLAVIRSTLDLSELWVSEALLDEVAASPTLELLGPPGVLPFDHEGNLVWS